MYTLLIYRIAGILYERQRRRGGTSRSYIQHRVGAVGELNPSAHSRVFTYVSVGTNLLSYLFTSAIVRIPSHTGPKCGKNYPICDSPRSIERAT